MSRYTVGAGARKHQLSATSPRASKAKAGVQPQPGNDNRRAIRFKLLVNRSAICALSANGKTLELMQHQIDRLSKAKVTFIHVRKDASGGEIELVTDRDLEPVVLEHLQTLGTQLK